MCHDLTLEYPYLDAADTIGGESRTFAIINLGAQCMQRHAAFTIPFGTRDLCTTKTTGTVDPHALCTKTHGRLHGALHSTTEADTALQLLGNILSNKLGIDFRLADFDDIQANLAANTL